MKLVEAWQDAAIREGFAQGRPLKQIAAETGLSALEVLQRQLAHKAMPSQDSDIEAPDVACGSPGQGRR
jgi:hypothetical protein